MSHLKGLSRFGKSQKEERRTMVRLDVKGMTCMHCAGTVKKAVESVQGTSNVVVDLDGKKVEFDLDDDAATEQIRERIRAAGFEA
jgi:copper chaperone CopZ